MDKLFGYFNKLSLRKAAFLQAILQLLYVALVGMIFWEGNAVFGEMNNYLGPVVFLTLFVVSALISALIVLGYPFYLFWEEKKTSEAIRLVAYTTAWLAFFIISLMILLILLK